MAGSGNETLNAAGSSGGNFFLAGSGSDSLIGGTGPDQFKFMFGHAGGNDTIGNWNATDTLVLAGYAAHGGFSETTINGNATIALHDGTTFTFKDIANIPSARIVLT